MPKARHHPHSDNLDRLQAAFIDLVKESGVFSMLLIVCDA